MGSPEHQPSWDQPWAMSSDEEFELSPEPLFDPRFPNNGERNLDLDEWVLGMAQPVKVDPRLKVWPIYHNGKDQNGRTTFFLPPGYYRAT